MAEGEEIVIVEGQLKKKILRTGTGSQGPPKGSDVEVHYVGKLLDGTVFDSSRDRGDTFHFEIGKGAVIKGWDEGVKTMRKGELCLLTCEPDYAYGANGSPPKIPANATLQFEVELLGWDSGKDFSEKKDKSIVKVIVTEGDGWEKPKEESEVTLKIKGKVKDSETSFIDESEFKAIIGEENMPAGLEKAITEMKKGEEAEIFLAAYQGYGAAGDSALGVPAGADLEYTVALVDFTEDKNSWEMSTEEKLEGALARKNLGNDFFKKGKYSVAIAKYKRGLGFIEHDTSFTDEEKEKSKAVKLPCFLNQAACELKLKNYSAAVESCDKALKIDNQSVKGLFRKGQAQFALDDWDSAEANYNAALKVDTQNKAVRSELSKLKRKRAEQDKKDRKAFSAMFSKSLYTEEETRVEKKEDPEEMKDDE